MRGKEKRIKLNTSLLNVFNLCLNIFCLAVQDLIEEILKKHREDNLATQSSSKVAECLNFIAFLIQVHPDVEKSLNRHKNRSLVSCILPLLHGI